MIRLNRSESPAHTPSGMPMSSATKTADRVSASVSMLSCHRPCSPKKVKPATARRATRQLPTAQETYPASPTTPSQPICGTGRLPVGCEIRDWTNVTRLSMARRISLKK